MGAPDHFSNSQFQFSFASGCLRVRSILIGSDDSRPGFRFLLFHCSGWGEGHTGRLCSSPGLGCLCHITKHIDAASLCTGPFLRKGRAWLLPSLPRFTLAAGSPQVSHRCLAGHPRCPGHPRAATDIPELLWALTFPLRSRKLLARAGCSVAHPLHHSRETWVPVTGHFFPSISEAGLPHSRASLAAGNPRAGLHVMGLCRVFAPSLFFIHVGWKNVFMS